MVPVARKIKKVEGLEAHQDLARGFIGGSGALPETQQGMLVRLTVPSQPIKTSSATRLLVDKQPYHYKRCWFGSSISKAGRTGVSLRQGYE